MPGFVLLVRERADGDPAMRYGITVTKKIGGAVIRNRMKRRFRVLAQELLPQHGVPGADHVLIGRTEGVERDFSLLRSELEKALRKVRGQKTPAPVQPEPVEGPHFSSRKTREASTGPARTEKGKGSGR